jgi:uncharacterized protein YjiS (DUF1127 family)
MSLSAAFVLYAQPLPPLSRLAVALALTLAAWELRRRSRKQLNRLSPVLLRLSQTQKTRGFPRAFVIVSRSA